MRLPPILPMLALLAEAACIVAFCASLIVGARVASDMVREHRAPARTTINQERP